MKAVIEALENTRLEAEIIICKRCIDTLLDELHIALIKKDVEKQQIIKASLNQYRAELAKLLQ